MKETVAGKVALLFEMLGRKDSMCEHCGQAVPGSSLMITKKQALKILNQKPKNKRMTKR